MKLAIGVLGGVLIGGYLVAQLSMDAVMLGVIGGGIIGALVAKRFGANTEMDSETGVWGDELEQDTDGDDWGSTDE